LIEPVERVEPPPAAPAPAGDQPEPLAARFATAAAALGCAGQLIAIGRLAGTRIEHDQADGSWWLRLELPIGLARQIIGLCGGRLYLDRDGGPVPDRGWGEPAPVPGWDGGPAHGKLRPASILSLVQAAGLHPAAEREATEAALLVPGTALVPLTRRALDLGLEVNHQPVALTPLFVADPETVAPGAVSQETAGPDAANPEAPTASPVEQADIRFALRLRQTARDGRDPAPVPPSLLAALERDPLVLVCREVSDGLLVQRGLRSPLGDAQLAGLVPAHERWLLADHVFGCARLTGMGEPQDSACLVRLGAGYALVPVPVPDRAVPFTAPRSRPVEVVRERTSGVPVDACLLDDEDLDTLPVILEGHPLAEAAALVLGRDRHLLTCAGGLLERLPVGEPLYAVGPGPLYLPLGYRLRPRLPATARQALFQAGTERAIVLQPSGGLIFDASTENRVPVWSLWAGALPELDLQIDAAARAQLRLIEDELRLEAAPVTGEGRPRRSRRAERDRGPSRPWQEEALEAELAGDLIMAAQLCERHGDLLRAAHLYERSARELGVRSPL
jgi:hypothetical protein